MFSALAVDEASEPSSPTIPDGVAVVAAQRAPPTPDEEAGDWVTLTRREAEESFESASLSSLERLSPVQIAMLEPVERLAFFACEGTLNLSMATALRLGMQRVRHEAAEPVMRHNLEDAKIHQNPSARLPPCAVIPQAAIIAAMSAPQPLSRAGLFSSGHDLPIRPRVLVVRQESRRSPTSTGQRQRSQPVPLCRAPPLSRGCL